MIKANELRLGNYIHLGGNTTESYQTYKKVLVTASITQDILEENEERGDDYILSVFQPIRLSPEILEQCGFEFDKGMHEYTHKDDNAGIFIRNELRVMGENRLVIKKLTNGFYVETYYGGIQIKSLHQLQNLYHALTGEELTINLSESVKTE
jgi:hypothetical protein